jgi:hypothetical protein
MNSVGSSTLMTNLKYLTFLMDTRDILGRKAVGGVRWFGGVMEREREIKEKEKEREVIEKEKEKEKEREVMEGEGLLL